jgi:endonuclease/exonuclease/phosphatase family metal-dependent hydrolase
MMLHLSSSTVARRITNRLPIAVLTIALIISGCGLTEGAEQVVKDRYRLTVMTLNIVGALPEYSSNPEIPLPWRTRYTRIAEGFKQHGVMPDVIALQEVTARKEWVGSRDPDDHEALHFLISKLNNTISVQYRIAFLGAADTNHPGLVQGQAVLYNPARLKNVTKYPSHLVQPGDSRPTVIGVNPRKSYPCAVPAEEFRDLCQLLDGDGTYWTSVFTDGRGDKHFATGQVRFAFAADEQSQFNFYDVHLDPTVTGSVKSATDLINFIESLKFDTPIYPPIVAGDFNGGIERFPTFDELAGASIDYVIGGKHSAFAAKHGFIVSKSALLPGESPNPDGMCAPRAVAWSDHCALVTQLEPGA